MKTKILDYNVLSKNGRIYTGGKIPKYVPVYSKALDNLNEEENDTFIIGFARLSEETDGIIAKFFLNCELSSEHTLEMFEPFGTGNINTDNTVIDYELLGIYIS